MGRIRDRIRARRNAKKPQKQFYGGDEAASQRLRTRNEQGIRSGAERETQGLDMLDAERRNAGARFQNLDQTASAERNQAAQRYAGLLDATQVQQRLSARQGSRYGGAADRGMRDYAAGRGATLGNAAEIETLARNAPGQYQSAADAAFKASTERNQRNALGLAAGRGNDSIRTALATADAGNRQAMLEQQVVRAQEANDLLNFQRDAFGRAADIRGSVGAADTTAAGVQAQRQQAAQDAVNKMLGLRGDITGADSAAGAGAIGQRAEMLGADVATGMTAAGARADAGAAQQGRFFGAEGMQEGAQLGSNMAFEQGRQQAAQGKGFTGFLGKLAGGLNNVKATADAGSFGPGTKLLGKQQPTQY